MLANDRVVEAIVAGAMDCTVLVVAWLVVETAVADEVQAVRRASERMAILFIGRSSQPSSSGEPETRRQVETMKDIFFDLAKMRWIG